MAFARGGRRSGGDGVRVPGDVSEVDRNVHATAEILHPGDSAPTRSRPVARGLYGLQGVFDAGYVIDGTWPVRTELSNRTIGIGANTLASSIVLVCRKRSPHAPVMTRREFVARLRAALPWRSRTSAPVVLDRWTWHRRRSVPA